MIEIAYYHRGGRTVSFASSNELLSYLRRQYPGDEIRMYPSREEIIQKRERYACSEHPKREAQGYYTAVDENFIPTGQVYLCSACCKSRGDAWLDLGDATVHIKRPAWLVWVDAITGSEGYIARVVYGEEQIHLPRAYLSRKA